MTKICACFFFLDSDNPRGFNDQKLHCTIVKLDKKTNKVYVKAAKCDTNHSILCQTSDKGT